MSAQTGPMRTLLLLEREMAATAKGRRLLQELAEEIRSATDDTTTWGDAA